MWVCVCVCVCVCVYLVAAADIYIHMYMYVYVCICMYLLRIYIPIYIYIYMYIYRCGCWERRCRNGSSQPARLGSSRATLTATALKASQERIRGLRHARLASSLRPHTLGA